MNVLLECSERVKARVVLKEQLPPGAASLTHTPSAFNAHLLQGCIWLAIQLKDGCHGRPFFNINVCIGNIPINSLVSSDITGLHFFFHSMHSLLDLVFLQASVFCFNYPYVVLKAPRSLE